MTSCFPLLWHKTSFSCNYNYMIKQVSVILESKLPIIVLRVWRFFSPKNEHVIFVHTCMQRHYEKNLWLPLVSGWFIFLSFFNSSSLIILKTLLGAWDLQYRKIAPRTNTERMSTWGEKFKETWFKQKDKGGNYLGNGRQNQKRRGKSVFLHRPLNLPKVSRFMKLQNQSLCSKSCKASA